LGKKERILIFLFFIAISVFVFREVVFKGWRCGDREAILAGVFSVSFYIALSILKYSSFLWNPYILCGLPLFAELERYNLLSPFTLLVLALQFFFGLSNLTAFNFVYMLYFPLAGFFTYLYARSIGIGTTGAVVSGIIFGLIRDADLSELNTYIWFPFILFLIEMAIAQKRIKWYYIIISGVFYGIQFYGSHPQHSYYFSIIFIFYLLFRYLLRSKEERPKKYLPACFLIFVIAIGISAIQFIPAYELAKLSARFYFKDYSRMLSEGYLDQIFSIGIILCDSDHLNAFVGIIPVFLALLPLFLKEKSKFYYFYLITALFFFVLSGQSVITRFLYYHMPYFSFFKNPIRASIISVLSIAILAGLGVEKLKPLLVRLVMAGAILLSIYYPHRKTHGELDTCRPLLLSRSEGFDEDYLRYLSINRFFSEFKDVSRYRVVFSNPQNIYLLRDSIHSFGGGSNFVLRRYLEFTHTSIHDIDTITEEMIYPDFFFYPNYLKLANVKYIILGKKEENFFYGMDKESIEISHFQGNPLFEMVYDDNVIKSYQFKDPLPRAMFITNALYLQDRQKILDLLKQPSFDPKTTLILEEPTDTFSLSEKKNLETNVQITKYLPARIEISLTTNVCGFLLLLDTYYPGWKAYVNNNLVQIHRADYLFRAIYIDKPGTYTIRFIYSPFSFKLGAAITLITLFGCIVGMIWIGKRNNRVKRNAKRDKGFILFKRR